MKATCSGWPGKKRERTWAPGSLTESFHQPMMPTAGFLVAGDNRNLPMVSFTDPLLQVFLGANACLKDLPHCLWVTECISRWISLMRKPFCSGYFCSYSWIPEFCSELMSDKLRYVWSWSRMKMGLGWGSLLPFLENQMVREKQSYFLCIFLPGTKGLRTQGLVPL